MWHNTAYVRIYERRKADKDNINILKEERGKCIIQLSLFEMNSKSKAHITIHPGQPVSRLIGEKFVLFIETFDSLRVAFSLQLTNVA